MPITLGPTNAGPALYLLGRVELKGLSEDSTNRLLTQSKVVALLACLALSPSGAFTRRDRLAGLLWPELDQAHARTALRKAVHLARTILGDEALISRGDEDLSLSAPVLWCDAVDLRGSLDLGHFARAVDLYQGPLMPGFFLPECAEFDNWLEDERASLQEGAVGACWALAQHLESANDRTLATRYAKKMTRLDKSNERLLRRAMQMLVRLGDRAGALAVYDEFARRLEKELGIEPSQETKRMLDDIRAGRPVT